ncbi:MAG TPA: FAD-dependent monooxygenase, partial [Polyangiaceae bacterium]|nr:FAD-dependent monooxygenase [Polyangiaceae bacterium]
MMMSTDLASSYDLIIVGLGPVGAVAANYAGLWGLKTLVLERDTGSHGQPRAFSCDEEAMRIYQQILLDRQVLEMSFADDIVDYVGMADRVFAQVDIGKVDRGVGFAALHLFHQPALEALLREGARSHDSVAVSLDAEVTEVRQDGDQVRVTARHEVGGGESHYEARFVLACDGARSSVRKGLGIEMVGEPSAGSWLAVSGVVEDAHVKLRRTSFICQPKRPVFVGRGPFNQYRLEFKLREDEHAAEVEKPELVRRMIEPYVDPNHFEIQRAAVYTFSNREASTWRQGNVFLVGDAAHTLPPFMGQGLVSGLRDCANLVWKVALVVRGFDPAILASYEQERRPHTREMADISVKMGKVFLTSSPLLAHVRDAAFRLAALVPSVRRYLRGLEFKPWPLHRGGLYTQWGPVGTYFPQPTLASRGGGLVRLDDLLGKGFGLVCRGPLPESLDETLWGSLQTAVVSLE